MKNLQQVLEFLSRNKLRASYRDVAGFLGLPPRALSEMLEPRRPEASWVVNAETGKPSGYSEAESDPDLRSNDVISDEAELRARFLRDQIKPRPRRAITATSSGAKTRRLGAARRRVAHTSTF